MDSFTGDNLVHERCQGRRGVTGVGVKPQEYGGKRELYITPVENVLFVCKCRALDALSVQGRA